MPGESTAAGEDGGDDRDGDGDDGDDRGGGDGGDGDGDGVGDDKRTHLSLACELC